MIKKRAFLAFLLFWSVSTHCAKLLTGDITTDGATTSFSFDLLPQVGYDSASEILYVAAATGTAASGNADIDKFYLAGVASGGTAFTAAAPATATINGVAGTTNPLYGEGISFLGMANNTPVVVGDNSANTLYWITSKLGASTQTILSNADIKDANEGTTTGVKFVTGVGSNCVVAAVEPNGAGAFGAANSGIAVLIKNITGTALTQSAAVDGSADIKAVPIALSTTALKITTDLASIGSTVDMFWDAPLQRLYVALQVTGADNTSTFDGARSIMVGRFKSGILNFDPIAVDAAFSATSIDEIVGAKGANVNVQAHKVRVLHSSPGPSYLVVLGNASETNPQKTVYALRLVDRSKDTTFATTWQTDNTTHGTLATSTIGTYFVNTIVGTPQVFSGKAFTTAAGAGELLTEASVAAKVGGGVISGDFGNIQDVQVYKDTVFAHVIEDGTPTDKPGIFYSQALFDENGVIKGWTTWQRVTHPKAAETDLHAFAYAPILGNLFTVDGATTEHTVNITEWGSSDNNDLLGGTAADASVGLISQLNSEFSGNGGIFGLFDFPNGTATSAFVTTPAGSRTAMMVATGYKKVVMALTMSEVNAGDGPFTGDFSNDKKTYTNGAITAGDLAGTDTVMISISGGVLDNLEAITCAEIVVENDGGADDGTYFVVGGTKGLAVLRQATTNYSWIDTGLTTFFQNIDANLNTFVEIGNYTNVRKIWGDDDSLYVMTDKKLDRIPVNTLDGTITATPVATLAGLGLADYDSFSDCAISTKFAVIGTNKGLFRVANGADVQGTPTWTKFTGFQGGDDRPIKKIQVISPTALKEAFATSGNGGQLYVLESSVGLENSQVHIFDVAADGAGTIDGDTLKLVSNVYVKNTLGTEITSPYFFAGYNYNYFGTDGAFLTTAEPEKNGNAGKFTRVPLQVTGGGVFRKSGEKQIDFGVADLGLARGFVRNTALGSTLVYGDFGVRVHE